MRFLWAFFPLCVLGDPFNTFDGPGFPACNEVAAVYSPTSVDGIQSLVQDAISSGQRVRASGKGHMWYDTMCSDNPDTVIIQTENVNTIYDFDLEAGSVMVEAGVTFLQLADYLHARGASVEPSIAFDGANNPDGLYPGQLEHHAWGLSGHGGSSLFDTRRVHGRCRGAVAGYHRWQWSTASSRTR